MSPGVEYVEGLGDSNYQVVNFNIGVDVNPLLGEGHSIVANVHVEWLGESWLFAFMYKMLIGMISG